MSPVCFGLLTVVSLTVEPPPTAEPVPVTDELPVEATNIGVAAVPPPADGDLGAPPTEAIRPDEVTLDAAILETLVRTLGAGSAKLRKTELEGLVPLKDPRVVVALTYIAIHDNDEGVAVRAVGVLTEMATADAVAAVARLADSHYRRAVAEVAVAALGELKAPAAGERLFVLANDDEMSADLRRQARDVLAASYPELVAARGVPKVSGSRILPALTGAAFGGYTLYTVGTFSKTNAGRVIGGIGGTLIGGATGYLLSQDLTTERSFLYLSTGGWGLYTGLMVGGLTAQHPGEKLVLSLGLAGELAGLGAAYAAGDALHYSAGDLWLVDTNGIAASLIAVGGLQFAQSRRDDRPAVGTVLGASLVGLTATGVVTRSLHFDTGDRMLSTLGALEGAWVGGFTPALFQNDHAFGGTLVGAGAGLFAAEAASQLVDLGTGDVLQAGLVAGYGHMLGAGLGYLGGARYRFVDASQLSLGLVGMLGTAAYGDALHYARGDFVIIPVATAIGFWHGVALGNYLDENDIGGFDERKVWGLNLALPAAAGLGAMAVSQFVDPSAWSVGMGSTGALWGAWFAVWTEVLRDRPGDEAMLVALAGTDVGLVASAILVSPLVDLDPTIVAGASLGGVTGTGIVSLIASLITSDKHALITTNLVASAVGLAVGGVVTSMILAGRAGGDQAGATAQRGFDLELPPFVLVPQPIVGRDGGVDGMAMMAVF